MDKTAFEPRIGLGLEAVWEHEDRGPSRICDLPRFFVESGRARTVGKPAVLCGIGPVWLRLGRLSRNHTGRSDSFLPVRVALVSVGLLSLISNGFPLSHNRRTRASFGGNLQSQNLDFKQGMVQQYNLNIERQLPGDFVLTVGYAGSRSTHILVDGLNLNIASPSACDPTKCNFDPAYTFGCGSNLRPYGNFGTIANIN